MKKVLFPVLMVVALIGFLYFSGSVNQKLSITSLSDDKIYLPLWGNIRCVDTFTQKYDEVSTFNKNVQQFYCDGIHSQLLGDESTVSVMQKDILLQPSITIKKCSINDALCNNPKETFNAGFFAGTIKENVFINVLTFDCQTEFIQYSGSLALRRTINDEVQGKQSFKPYQLIDESSGSKLTPISNNCNLQGFKDVISLSDYSSKINPGEFRNYISNIVLAPADGNTYTYKGKLAICSGNQVYLLGETTKMADGEIIRFTDSTDPILVDCCPSLPGCTKDFKIDTTFIQPGKECSNLKGVPDGFFPSTTKQGQVCEIECVNNTQTESNCHVDECLGGCGAGSICLQNRKCLKITNPTECPSGYSLKETTTKGFIEEEVTKQCVKDFNLTPLWIALGFLGAAILLVIIKKSTGANGGDLL